MNLVSENDLCLRTTTQPWDLSLDDPEPLYREMYDFMLKNRGVGLAAPQIGCNKRMFVMGDGEYRKCVINPIVIKELGEDVKINEGCLSFPGLVLPVIRRSSVLVEYYDEKGLPKIEMFEGLWARCFLHELDHCNGIVFTTKVSRLMLDMKKRKREKLVKGLKK